MGDGHACYPPDTRTDSFKEPASATEASYAPVFLFGIIYLAVLAGIVVAVVITIHTLRRMADVQDRPGGYLEEMVEHLRGRP